MRQIEGDFFVVPEDDVVLAPIHPTTTKTRDEDSMRLLLCRILDLILRCDHGPVKVGDGAHDAATKPLGTCWKHWNLHWDLSLMALSWLAGPAEEWQWDPSWASHKEQ